MAVPEKYLSPDKNPELFLTDKDIDRSAREIPLLTYLVLKESLIRFLDVLRQIREENERGYARSLQLHAILYLDVFSLD